jgi:hypothetical protein
MSTTSPFRLALVQNVADAFDSRFKVVNFTRALHSVLQKLGLMRRLESHMRAMHSIDLDLLDTQLAAKYKEHVESLQGGARAGGGMIGHYFRVVGTHELGVRPCWYQINVPHKAVVRFLRFRLGCHFLRINTGRWHQLARGDRRCVRCSGEFENAAEVPVDDETHCLISCQEPVLVQYRQQLQADLRACHLRPAAQARSMQELFAVVEKCGSKRPQRYLMQFVAKCYKVVGCCHEDLECWNSGREVQAALSDARLALWVLQQEALYAAGQVPGLPSDSSEEESSELEEVFLA